MTTDQSVSTALRAELVERFAADNAALESDAGPVDGLVAPVTSLVDNRSRWNW